MKCECGCFDIVTLFGTPCNMCPKSYPGRMWLFMWNCREFSLCCPRTLRFLKVSLSFEKLNYATTGRAAQCYSHSAGAASIDTNNETRASEGEKFLDCLPKTLAALLNLRYVPGVPKKVVFFQTIITLLLELVSKCLVPRFIGNWCTFVLIL